MEGRVTRWRSWLRHCAQSWKVAGSIPDGVNGIFHWHKPSGRIIALWLTQPLKETSTRNISWVRKADKLNTFMCRMSWNLGVSSSWNPQDLSRIVMGLIYLYTGCHRRKGPNFGRVFLMLNYTDITKNTYIQSWTVTEIMAREVWNFDSCYSLIYYQIHIETGRNMWFL